MRVLLVTVAAALGAAAPASAFELANPAAAPGDAKAGAHSDVRIHVEPREGQIRDLDLHFPPGLVGDPKATSLCPLAQFEADACPADTQVGTSTTSATLFGLPQTLPGEIFNIERRGPEQARLGIRIRPSSGAPIRLESPVTVRPSDSGLDSTLRDIPNSFEGLPITITALDVVLSGRVAGGRAFMRNPTSCGDKETGIEARSWGDERASAKAAYTSTACQDLPFTPMFDAVVGARGETAKGSHPPVTTTVTQEGEQANVRRVEVTLPRDLAVGADRLARACLAEQYAAGTCAPNSRVGEATAITPLLDGPLSGPVVFLADKNTLPDLALSLTGPLSLTLRGTNAFGPGGQTTTFDGLPDVPLSRFELGFLGGDDGLLAATRDLCAGRAPRLVATFFSQGGAERTQTISARVAGCRPVATLELRRLRGGRPSLRVRVTAGTARVRRLRLTLPKGLRLRRGALPRTSGSGLRGARVRTRGRTVAVTTPEPGARSLTLSFRGGKLLAARRLRRARRLPFVVDLTDGGGERSRSTVRARASR